MAEYLIHGETLTAIADAIREKGGTSSSLTPAGMVTAVENISVGVDTSDATAAAGDILSGKTAYVDGEKITGTIATKTSSNLTASGATVSVPAGYYASTASKSVATATQATPSVSIDSAGKITASATQTAGYVSAGTKTGTKQLTTQAAKTVTPSASEQTAVASGVYTTGEVKVAGDANLIADNIKEGVSIFGITGAFAGSLKIETGTFTPSSSDINGTPVSVTGLSGEPKILVIHYGDTSEHTHSSTMRSLMSIIKIDGVVYSTSVYYKSSNVYMRYKTTDYILTYNSTGFTLKGKTSSDQASTYPYRYYAIM